MFYISVLVLRFVFDRKYLILKVRDVWLKVKKNILILNWDVFLSIVGPF